jgi:tetratricopeptide (TPR) repeat protein
MGRSLDINVATKNLWGISILKSIISLWIYAFQGKIDLAYDTSNEALQLAEESGDIYSKAYAQSCHGYVSYCKGFLDEAEDNLIKASELFERINFFLLLTITQKFLGDFYFDMGKYQKSQDAYKKAILVSDQNRALPPFINLCKISLALIKVVNNKRNFNLESLYDYAIKNNIKIFEGCMIRRIGRIILYFDDKYISDAEDWIKKAIEADKKNGTMWSLGRDYTTYAELLGRKGDRSKAEASLKKAIKIFKECGAAGWVQKYEKALTASL